MLYEVYRHCLTQSYRASICSKATIFQIVSISLTVVAPLLVAYRSQGFWKKVSHYEEQPRVTFQHRFIFFAETGAAGSDYVVWSTYPGLNLIEKAHLRIATIRSREIDHNRDGKMDELELQVSLPLAPSEAVRGITLLLFFEYELAFKSRFRMQTMGHIREFGSGPSTALSFMADLCFHQKTPLKWRGRDVRDDFPIINDTQTNIEEFRLPRLFQRFSARNFTTRLTNAYSAWTPGVPGIPFELECHIRFPVETFAYYTGFWELIKWAWIQYLAILIIFIFVMRKIRQFVFENQLVTTIPYENPQLRYVMKN